MSNLNLGTSYSNARGSLLAANGKGSKGGSGSGGGLTGNVELTLPVIPVDVDWTLTKNQGATLAIKNKPDLGVAASSLAAVARTGQYTDLLSKPALSTVATTGRYSDLLSKPTLTLVSATGKYSDLVDAPVLSTVATTGNFQDLNQKPALAGVAASGSYTDLINVPPQLGDVELQLQNVPTDVDWNLTSNQGATLAIKNKPDMVSIKASTVTASTFTQSTPQIGYWSGTITTTGNGYEAPTATLVPLPQSVIRKDYSSVFEVFNNYSAASQPYSYGCSFIRLPIGRNSIWNINVTATGSNGITSLGILPLNGAYKNNFNGSGGNPGFYGENTLTSGDFGGSKMLGLVSVPGAITLTTQYTGPFLGQDELTVAVAAPAGTVTFRIVISNGLGFTGNQ